jgi:hypothetical protein
MRPNLWLYRLLCWIRSKLAVAIERISQPADKISSENGAPAHWLAATSGVKHNRWIESSPVQRPTNQPPNHWIQHIAQANRRKEKRESVDLNNKPKDNTTLRRLIPTPNVELPSPAAPMNPTVSRHVYRPYQAVDQTVEHNKTAKHVSEFNELPQRIRIKLPIRPGSFGADSSLTHPTVITETHNSNDNLASRNLHGLKVDQIVERSSAPKLKVTLTPAHFKHIARNIKHMEIQPAIATTEAEQPGRVNSEPARMPRTQLLSPAITTEPGEAATARVQFAPGTEGYEFRTRSQTNAGSRPDISVPFRQACEDHCQDYPMTARSQDAGTSDYWPSLPEISLTAKSETSTRTMSELVRRQRIDLEQEGALWNV